MATRLPSLPARGRVAGHLILFAGLFAMSVVPALPASAGVATTVAFIGPSSYIFGRPGTISGKLLAADGTPLPEGTPATLEVGSYNSPCEVFTDAAGNLSCPMFFAVDPPGPTTVSARFAGNDAFEPSEQIRPATMLKATPEIVMVDSGPGETPDTIYSHINVVNTPILGGVLTFQLFAESDTTCAHPLETRSIPMESSGNGVSGDIPVSPGTYYWVVTYGGNQFNNGVTLPCTAPPAPAPPAAAAPAAAAPAPVIKAKPVIPRPPSRVVPAAATVPAIATLAEPSGIKEKITALIFSRSGPREITIWWT